MNQLLFICEYKMLVFFRNPNIRRVRKLIFFCHMLLHTNQDITVAIRYTICKGIRVTLV